MSAPIPPSPHAFRLVFTDERLAASRVVKATIFGQPGIGKTSLLSVMTDVLLPLAIDGDR